MPIEIQITLSPEFAYNVDEIKQACVIVNAHAQTASHIEVLRRSIDARKAPAKYLLKCAVYLNNELFIPDENINYPLVDNQSRKIHIIGAGPAGLFAALQALELGFKPVVFERGKDVKARRRDLALLNKSLIVNPESNYCFGEGGAGTYSDGKLYTRSTKRGNVTKILQVLVQFGAPETILTDAHPHIGTNKLPQIIRAMREQIIASGGEVHFNSKLSDLLHKNNSLEAFEINGTEWHTCTNLILATGHSARDIFELLHRTNIAIEVKPFAIGVRAEHAQTLIDNAQYKTAHRGEFLPPASYSVVEQVNGKGVFSFCMCPGGIIAPCATEQNEVVTNGWSPSKRNNPYANSGIVVSVDEIDFQKYGFTGPLAGLQYQKMVEHRCWEAAGKTQKAPAQRLVDFVNGVLSKDLPSCSYIPGVVSARLDLILPIEITERLQAAFKSFGNKIRQYYSNDAILVAPESRTSSPVRILRDKESLQHPYIKGLYPCGEGAGYAGGIVSAAIDGENCAKAAADFLLHST